MTDTVVRKHTDGRLTIHSGRTLVGYWRYGEHTTKHRPRYDAVIFPKGPSIEFFENASVTEIRAWVAHGIERLFWQFPSDRPNGRPRGFKTIHSHEERQE